MATRNGGGVYIAFCKGYPTCDNVVLWKYGTTKLLKIPGSQGASHVAISPAPSGRLWIAFEDEDDNLHAVRTNTTAKKIGAVRTIKRTKSAGPVYKIAIEGTRARADLLFNDGDEDLAPAAVRRTDADGPTRRLERQRVGEGHVQGHRRRRRHQGRDGQGQVQRQQAHLQDRGQRQVLDHVPEDGQDKIKVTAKKSGYAPDETS